MSRTVTPAVFEPFSVKSLTLKNRIVMAPMTRCFSPNGVPGQNVAEYYARRAEADVGLMISEGTGIGRKASLNDPAIPHFYGEAPLAGWKAVIDAVHTAGGKMAPQIWHVGGAPVRPDWEPEGGFESPSGVTPKGEPLGHKMSDEDIADTIAAFGQAAADAKRLGFDTVEIHGAHGYLIDQFFWSAMNKRDDAYGGSTIEARNRFALEVIKAVRAAVGPIYPVILRLSQWKQQDYTARIAQTPKEMEAWLNPLVDAGVDILHCSQRRFWEPEFADIDGEKGLNFAGWAKKITGAPTISVGSVGLSDEFFSAFAGQTSQPASASIDELNRRIEAEEFDMIAVGRGLLADPHWAEKLKDGKPLEAFDPASLQTLY